MGLGNACINPILYGYFNESFRQEYKSLFKSIPWHSSHVETAVQDPSNNPAVNVTANPSPMLSNHSLIIGKSLYRINFLNFWQSWATLLYM